MILLVAVTCWIGIAAVAAAVGEGHEIESLTVPEGGNLTISSHVEKWDEDTQVLVFRLRNDSSLEPIAQLFCDHGACTQKLWRDGVSLISDGENVTLILMHVSYSQTGLYEFRKHSKRRENKIYNVTVYQPPLATIIPEKTASATYSKFPAEIKAVTVSAVLVVLALVSIIGTVIYRRHKDKFCPEMIDGSAEASRWHRSQSDHSSYL